MTPVSRPWPCSSASSSARRTSSTPPASPRYPREIPRQWTANAGSGSPSSAERIAKPVGHEPEAGQDTAGRHGIPLPAVKVDGLFERLTGLLQPALLLGGLPPALQQRGAPRVVGRGELQ